MIVQSAYLKCVFNKTRFQRLIKNLIKKIKEVKKHQPFDAIAFSGVSGAAVAFVLQWELGIPLICVRKGKSHSIDKVEGFVECKRYIIVDDFIESGKTIDKIVSSIRNVKCVGIVLYNPDPGDILFKKEYKKIPVFALRAIKNL